MMAEAKAMNVLVIGAGAREHAYAWKLSQSSTVGKIFVCPGNAGTSKLDKCQNITSIQPDDFNGLVAFAKSNTVDLVVPGPEAPLVAGIADFCKAAGLRCFGPSKAASVMEGSKAFSKAFMRRHNLPTARYENFTEFESAKRYLETVDHKVVIKADGLAAGKGVIIPESVAEGVATLEDILLKKQFGDAGNQVVIEEFLEGQELSVLSFSDGYTVTSLPPAQDHKPIYDGDKGPMTGGMGCYSPCRIATPSLVKEIEDVIIRPTIRGMRQEGMPFVGILFTGLMITKNGPKVLEFNVRGGDPETETLLPLLSQDTDLAKVMIACADGYLDAINLVVEPKYSATVIAVAGGYPGSYTRGEKISLPSAASDSSYIWHAGTLLKGDDIVSNGGRVLAATAIGHSLQAAVSAAYSQLDKISFNGMFHRKDIAYRDLGDSSSSVVQVKTAKKAALTYADAGVSITAGNDLVSLIKPVVAATSRPGTDAAIGGFGGVFSLEQAGYTKPPLLIGAIDGVGTKLEIAQAMKKHDTVGIDCVAMNVNDLLVQGAESLFFLDCYTCGNLDVNIASQFIKGVAAGCSDAGCALIGGETAEMPGLFGERGNDGSIYDAVGAAVGAMPHGVELLPLKDSIKSGDVLIGMASAGIHSNGFSLVRKIVSRSGLSYHDQCPWDTTTTLGLSLLTPTRIYVRALMPLIRKNLFKGLSHITGGGLLENIPRMLPKTVATQLDAKQWTFPAMMRWLKREGDVQALEVARVWNCGLGMVGVVDRKDVDQILGYCQEQGLKAWEVGKLVDGRNGDVTIHNMEAWE